MRGTKIGLLGFILAGALAAACGSSDNRRFARDDAAGAGGDQGSSVGGQQPTDEEPGAGGDRGGGSVAGGGASTTTAAAGAAEAGMPDDSAGATSGPSGDFVPTAPRLALGGSHACALKLDQTVWCWGRDDHGELGDAVPVELVGPTPVNVALDDVSQLAAGEYHNCALVGSPPIATCWGGAWQGQLGDGSLHSDEMGIVPAPQPVNLDGVTQLAAGANHNCALLADQTVRCWGYALFGVLGDGTTSTDPTPDPVAAKDLTDVVQIAAGGFQSCALLADGTVKCWGSAGYTENGSSVSMSAPTLKAGVVGATTLDAGGDFTCAIVAGGKVRCWGEGSQGELGNADSFDSPDPVEVAGLTDVVQLSTGTYHSCALRRDRSLYCWGHGEFGELGDGVFHNGFPTYVLEPVRATAFDDVVEVACGGNSTCVRTSRDEVWCVGNGRHGQLGDGIAHDTLPYGSTTAVKALTL